MSAAETSCGSGAADAWARLVLPAENGLGRENPFFRSLPSLVDADGAGGGSGIEGAGGDEAFAGASCAAAGATLLRPAEKGRGIEIPCFFSGVAVDDADGAVSFADRAVGSAEPP